MHRNYYLVNGVIVFSRPDFERFILQHIYEDKLFNLRNLPPTTTIERNVAHHPLRIAKEIGLDVEYIK